MAFSPDGKHLAAMQAGPNACIWEVETGAVVSRLEIDSGSTKSLAFSPDGRHLVASRRVWSDPTRPADAPRPPDVKHPTGGGKVEFTPSGRFVVTRNATMFVAAGGPDVPALALDDPHGRATVNDFAFTRDESKLAVAYQSATAAVFDLTEPRVKHVLLKGHKGKQIRAIGFASDGHTVVTAGIDGTCRLWDAGTGAQLRAFDFGLGTIATAAFAPDGLTCAVGSAKGKVVVWDLDG